MNRFLFIGIALIGLGWSGPSFAVSQGSAFSSCNAYQTTNYPNGQCFHTPSATVPGSGNYQCWVGEFKYQGVCGTWSYDTSCDSEPNASYSEPHDASTGTAYILPNICHPTNNCEYAYDELGSLGDGCPYDDLDGSGTYTYGDVTHCQFNYVPTGEICVNPVAFDDGTGYDPSPSVDCSVEDCDNPPAGPLPDTGQNPGNPGGTDDPIDGGNSPGGGNGGSDGDPDTPDEPGEGDGDTDGDGSRDVDCNPLSNADCQFTGSGTPSSVCGTPPSCSGDPVQCAQLMQEYNVMCAVLNTKGEANALLTDIKNRLGTTGWGSDADTGAVDQAGTDAATKEGEIGAADGSWFSGVGDGVAGSKIGTSPTDAGSVFDAIFAPQACPVLSADLPDGNFMVWDFDIFAPYVAGVMAFMLWAFVGLAGYFLFFKWAFA